jgi:hypothetical protein
MLLNATEWRIAVNVIDDNDNDISKQLLRLSGHVQEDYK